MSGVGHILKSGSGSGSRAWLLYLTLGIVATGVYFLLSGAAQDTLYDLIGVSSVAAVLVGLWWYRPSYRLPWYVLAVAQSTFVAGDITYNIYENVLGIPALRWSGRRRAGAVRRSLFGRRCGI